MKKTAQEETIIPLARYLMEKLVQRLWMERGRWFLWWPVGMGLGISAYITLHHNPSVELWWCASLLALLAVRFLHQGGLIILSILWGFTAMHVETYRLSTPMLEYSMKNQTGQATVDEVEWRSDVARITCTLHHHPKIKRVRLKTPTHLAATLYPGDTIAYEADFIPISPPISPFSYDYRRACYFQGVGAVGRLKKITQHTHENKGNLSKWRYQITQSLRKHLPGADGEIAAALITGDRSGIPQHIRQAYADAGIAHILAISGLHVSIVAGLIFMLLRRGLGLSPYLNMRFPLKKIAAVACLPFVLGYVAISGFGFPALRSLIMLSLVMVGLLCDRPPFSMRSVMLAASILLTLWPSALFGVSFQLSFAAVIALLALYESRFDGWLRRVIQYGHRSLWRHWLVYVLSICATTIAATLATTPLTLVTFNRYTLQAILGNIAGIPLTGFWIMPAGVACLLSLLWGGSLWMFSLWAWGIQMLTRLAHWVATLPGSAITLATPYEAYLPCVVLAGLWLCLWRTYWRLAAVPILVGANIMIAYKPLSIAVFANPQGIAYIDQHTLHTAKPKAFLDEQWAKTSGCTRIEPWTTTWAVAPHNILIEHPWKKGGEIPKLENTNQQVLCWSSAPYPHAHHVTYRARGYGLPPHKLAEQTFYVAQDGHVTYLNEKRSPYRPWS